MNDRDDDKAIWGWKTYELWRRVASGDERCDDEAVPFLVQNLGVFVGLDVDGDHFGGKARGEFETVARYLTVVVDRNDGDRLGGVALRNHRDGAARDRGNGMIVPPHSGENGDQHRNEKEGDPGAFDEFCNEDDEDGDAGDEAAESVDERAFQPIVGRVSSASARPCRTAKG